MRIKNISSSKLIISDLPGATAGLGGLVIQQNEEEVIFNEDAEKSAELKSFIDGGQVTVLDQLEEPTTGTSVADATSEASTGVPGSDGITDTISATKASAAGEVLTATAAGIAGWALPGTPGAHAIGGASHASDTLANLNAKISDATLVDTADARFSDARTPTAHDLAGAEHNSATLGNLNAKISDATLDDSSAARPALSLKTTGADVVVNTSAPPSAGQVLKATSAIAAAWANDNSISVVTFISAASAGGLPTETITVAGLLATDTIIAVIQQADPGAGSPHHIISWGAPGAGSLSVTWSSDPGVGATVFIAVAR